MLNKAASCLSEVVRRVALGMGCDGWSDDPRSQQRDLEPALQMRVPPKLEGTQASQYNTTRTNNVAPGATFTSHVADCALAFIIELGRCSYLPTLAGVTA